VAITPVAGRWQTTTQTGRCYVSDAVVVAIGANRLPIVPTFANQEQFMGRMLHSCSYRNAIPFNGQRVLVVGMGNTGAEIALDLAEHGVQVHLSVRSPLNIVYRDVLGRPTQLTAIALSRLPTNWGDWVSRVLRDLTVGDLSRWGIRTSPLSPLRQLREHGKTPVIDIGTLACIKRGEIKVQVGIDAFTGKGVRFADGRESDFDAVIMATGYEAQVKQLFPDTPPAVDPNGMPTEVIGSGALEGVYFVGFDIRAPGGLLRTIGIQAQLIADEISRKQPIASRNRSDSGR
jgi:cation diffusion facilitator CzcD-associated flavoprotein CzcO